LSDESLFNNIKERISQANTLAVTLGSQIIGKVARHMPSKVTPDDFMINVSVDPVTYYKLPFLGRVGIFLGAVDIKTLYFVLLRIVGYERTDATSLFIGDSNVLSASSTNEDEPGSLITNVVVKCEPLTRMDVLSGGELEVADLVLEPQSPVFLPNPSVIEKALDTRRGGLYLGYLDNAYTKVKVGISPEDLNFHVSVLGTTGAGKTSFIKDVIASLYLSENESKIFVLDATGDYYNVFLPPNLNDPAVQKGRSDFSNLYESGINGLRADIVFPVTSFWRKKNKAKTLNDVTLSYFNAFVKPVVDFMSSKGLSVETDVKDNRIMIKTDYWKSDAFIHPFYFRFPEIKRIFNRLNPYFTEQASQFLRQFIFSRKEIRSLEELIKSLDDEEFERNSVHKSTRDNIRRGLYTMRDTGLFDVPVEKDRFRDSLEGDQRLVIFDLYNSEIEEFSQKILAYFFLDRIFDFRERQMRSGIVKGRFVIVVDEAHRFFPSGKGGEEDAYYVRKVAGKIATMMRLGRRRKLGFIFATHNPLDLSDIVVQLSNTKVLFRIKQEVGENMGLSRSEAKVLSWEKNGVAYILSPWFREGKIKLKVPVPPPLGHYDISRMS
jgi:DNA helicase HerA-like ATPase